MLQALVAEAGELPSEILDSEFDPVLQPINRLLGLFEDATDEERALFFDALIRRLGPEDRDRAWNAFVRDDADPTTEPSE
jgi:hypothetical protein